MQIRALYIVMLVLVATMCGCDGERAFKIDGEIEGGANTNLYIKYYGNNAVRTGVTAAREGKFTAEFSSADPTIVEILDNEYRVLGRLYLQNGDKVQVTIDRNNPFNNKVTGTEINEQWAALLNANAQMLASGDAHSINQFIDSYIESHPDDLLSTLMFASLYDYSLDPVHADSIAALISPELKSATVLGAYTTQIRRFADADAYAKVGKIRYRGVESDTSLTFVPNARRVSLLALSNENSHRSDSVVPYLRDIHKAYPADKFQMLDLGLYSDTLSWKFSCRHDSAKWPQGWVPGGVLSQSLNPLAIPRLPYYIVTDSAGRQKYRGPSITEAERMIKQLLK